MNKTHLVLITPLILCTQVSSSFYLTKATNHTAAMDATQPIDMLEYDYDGDGDGDCRQPTIDEWEGALKAGTYVMFTAHYEDVKLDTINKCVLTIYPPDHMRTFCSAKLHGEEQEWWVIVERRSDMDYFVQRFKAACPGVTYHLCPLTEEAGLPPLLAMMADKS